MGEYLHCFSLVKTSTIITHPLIPSPRPQFHLRVPSIPGTDLSTRNDKPPATEHL